MPAGTAATGLLYKIECFWFLVSGKLRIIEGDSYKDVEAPYMFKNVVGIKNAVYSYTDCHFYGVTPNPTNTRDMIEVINTYSSTPAKQVQNMGENKQQLNFQKRLADETV
jgi:hypothetical protein